jgi:hypothetical protein
MADKKISALTSASTPLAGTEVLPIVQSSATVKVSAANITAGRAVSTLSVASLGPNGIPITMQEITAAPSSATAAYVGVTTSAFPGGANGDLVLIPRSSSTNDVRVLVGSGTPTDALVVQGSTKNILASAGNIVMSTAGKGIDFSANTHAAGMTSELLNWYEEGAWTPSVGGDATYTIQEGLYVRVGDLVYVQCQLLLNILGTGSTTTISGLPFQAFSPSNSSRGTGSVWYCGNLATGVTTLTPGVTPAGQTITFGGFTVLGAGTTMSVPLTVFQNGTRVDFSLVYRAN